MTRWLTQPVVLTRAALFIGVTVLGLLAAAGVIGAGIAINTVADERSDRSARERRALEQRLNDRVESAERDAVAARRIARLERPTRAQLEARIRRALRIVSREPALRRRLQRELGIAIESTPAAPDAGGAPAPPGGADRAPTSPATPPQRRENQTPAPNPARPGPSTPSPPTSGTAQPPAGAPPTRPPVDVQTPDTLPLPRLPVCIPLLGGVNCP